MGDYEEAISQLVSTMQSKLYELQTERSSQISRRNSLTSRLAELRKSKSELTNYIQYLQNQISLLTESSTNLEEDKAKLATQLQNLAEKITSEAEQARYEKRSWEKESEIVKSKLMYTESQFRIEGADEENQMKAKIQEIARMEQSLRLLNEEIKENQTKVDHKRQLEASRVRHLEERSRIFDNISKIN